MNVKEIVETWLRDNNYDGLCTENCGCALEDLIPCDSPCDLCVPGYRELCFGPDACEKNCGWLYLECGWHITTEKPKGE